MQNRNFTIRALSEIAIRCVDKPKMVDFYENTIGVERFAGTDDDVVTFFKVAEGVDEHTSVLALFRYDQQSVGVQTTSVMPPKTGQQSSLHYIALSLPFSEQQAVMDWYDHLGQNYRVELFDWVVGGVEWSVHHGPGREHGGTGGEGFRQGAVTATAGSAANRTQ